MLSGAKPASVMVSRKGGLRLFQVGTLRPCLSLPSPVSTTIRRDGGSPTIDGIGILGRPLWVAKAGISQGSLRISSLVASGRMKRVLPTVSSSTIFVILTLPMFQCIRRFPLSPLDRALARAVDNHRAQLVALLHGEVGLRGVRQRELAGDIVDARSRGQPSRNVFLRRGKQRRRQCEQHQRA